MSFKPNMTEEQIRAEDMHRGRKRDPIEGPSMSAPPFRAYKKGIDTAETFQEDVEDDVEDGDEELEDDVEIEEGEEMEASIKGLQNYASKATPSQLTLQTPGMSGAKEGRGMAKSKLDKFVADMKKSKEEAKKALNTRSMYIPPPREPYDPFSIHNSASKATTRGHSALRGKEGTAPLIGETFAKLAEDEAVRTRMEPDAYKSCAVHGTTYRATRACHPCTIMKSMDCKCGGQMVKSPGGGMKCASCGMGRE